MNRVTLLSKSGKPFSMEETLEPTGRVPGYLITKDGNFLKVPDGLSHLEFFQIVLERYSEKEPSSEILEILDQLINQFGCSVYFGSEPMLRNFYLKGRLYVNMDNMEDVARQRIEEFVQNAYQRESFYIDAFSFPKKIDLLSENYIEKVEDFSKKR